MFGCDVVLKNVHKNQKGKMVEGLTRHSTFKTGISIDCIFLPLFGEIRRFFGRVRHRIRVVEQVFQTVVPASPVSLEASHGT